MKLKSFLSIGVVGTVVASTTLGMVYLAQKTHLENNGTKISKFENLLDVKGTPVDYGDSRYESKIAPFSDKGAWHAFSLPSEGDKDMLGGFTQPLIVRKESPISIAKSLDILSIEQYEYKNNKIVEDKDGTPKTVTRSLGNLSRDKVHLKQYPGGLWQEYEFKDFTLQINLRFVFDKTSMVKYKIINKTNKKLGFKLNWHGKLFDGAIKRLGAKFDRVGEALINSNPYETNDHGQAYVDGDKNKYLYVAFHKDAKKEKIREELVIDNSLEKYNYARSIQVEDSNNIKRIFSLVTPSELNKIGSHSFTKKNEHDPSNISNNTVSISFANPSGNWTGGRNWLSHPDDWKWQMKFEDDKQVRITTKDNSYYASLERPFVVGSNDSNEMYVSTSFTFTSQERTGFKYEDHAGVEGDVVKGQYTDLVKNALQNKDNAKKPFDKSGKRWLNYLSNLLGDDKDANFDYQKVAVKGMETLTTNWRGHAGMLEHQGVTPSLSVSWFNEFWSWDSWKQASAEVNFDPKLAMDNIKVLYDYQVMDDPTEDLKYHFDPERRKNDIGMIPDLVAYEQGETNWRDTKPPLSAWAVWNVYSKIQTNYKGKKDFTTGKDLQEESVEFLKYMYMRVMAYHNWWYLNRDGDSNGINEYGASLTDPNQTGWRQNATEQDISIAAAWESGMDNAVRFDWNGSGKNDNGLTYTMNRNKDGSASAYVLQQESVDLNAYMFAEKKYLAKMAQALKDNGVSYQDIAGNATGSKLNKILVKPMLEQIKTRIGGKAAQVGIMSNIGKSFEEDIKQLNNDSEYLKNYVNKNMFDDKTNFFYDLKWSSDDNGKREIAKDKLLVNRGKGPEGYLPLWAKMATKDHASRVRKVIMDPHGFNTKMPFPTAAWDNDKFEPDQYWRGPVWLDQATFGVDALYRNDFKNDASYMALKLFNNAEGLLSGGPIRENYNPITGKGLSSKSFSWSSGMYIMMYEKYIRGESDEY